MRAGNTSTVEIPGMKYDKIVIISNVKFFSNHLNDFVFFQSSQPGIEWNEDGIDCVFPRMEYLADGKQSSLPLLRFDSIINFSSQYYGTYKNLQIVST